MFANLTPNLTFIFIGRSGCGKGTQIELLKEFLAAKDQTIFSVETGNRFREFVKGKGYANLTAEMIMARGERQPEFLAAFMWSNELIENFKLERALIFDGTPRSLPEAKILDSALRFFGRTEVVVVYLGITRTEAEKRLAKRGRRDDLSQEEVEKRLDWFDKDVAPAIEFYRNHDEHTLLEINGEQSIEQIAEEIKEAINPRIS
jgi:adenylate kinase